MSGPLRFPESTKPINKVVLNGDIKIDLTGDTVQPSNLLKGIKAHGPDGNIITGTMTPSPIRRSPELNRHRKEASSTKYWYRSR